MGVPAARPAWLGAVVAAAVVVLGAWVWALAETPWPLIAASGCVVILAVTRFASGTFAVAVAAVLFVLVPVLTARLAPLSGLGISTLALIVFVAAGLAGSASLAIPATHRTARPGVSRAVAATVVPAVALVAVGGTQLTGRWGFVWAMHGDAAWNMVTARFIVSDGGLVSALHPNSSPATASLLAVIASAARENVASDALLLHDITRLSQLWIVLALLCSLMAGLVAVHTAHLGGVRRWIAGIVAGLVPLSWYVMGFAWEFGFLNAPIALVLLCASWIAWLECRISPIRGAALLSLSAVALLATWAPLAVVPAGLAAAALVMDRRRLRGSWRTVLAWVLVALPVPLYVVAFTLDDLHRDGAALAVDGAVPQLSVKVAAATAVVAIAAIAGIALRDRDPHRLVGVLALVGASAFGIGYLVAQRIPTGQPWGYYPVKMTWLILVLLLVLAIGSLATLIPVGRPVSVIPVLSGAVATIVLAAGAALVPPVRQPALEQVFPLADIVRGTGVAAPPDGADDLVAIARPGVKSIAAGYGDDDRFVNLWLLQLESDTSTDPVRTFAYTLDRDDGAQLCAAVRAWGGGVDVHTSDPELEDELTATCADAGWRVILHG